MEELPLGLTKDELIDITKKIRGLSDEDIVEMATRAMRGRLLPRNRKERIKKMMRSPKSKEACRCTSRQWSFLNHACLYGMENKYSLRTYCMIKRLILFAIK